MGRYCIIFMLKLDVVVHTSNPSTWVCCEPEAILSSTACLRPDWHTHGKLWFKQQKQNKGIAHFNIRLCLIFGSSLHLMEELKPVFLDVRIKRVNIHLFFCFLLSCLKPVMQARNRRFMTDSLLPLTTDIPVLNMFSWSCSLTILHLPSSCHTYWCFDHPPM